MTKKVGVVAFFYVLAFSAAEVRNVSLQDAYQMWNDGTFDLVIDVRTVENQTFANGWGWNHGHIPGSYALPGLNADPIDMETMGDYETTLCKDSKILVHCWVGVAGLKGARRLVSMGFHNVYAIQDAGIWAWEDAGYPIVYDDTFVDGMKPPCAGGVTFQDISTIHSEWNDGYFDFVIDVRTVENQSFTNGWGWNHGHIPGSFPLPGLNADPIDMETMGDYNTTLCKDSKILVHCWVGVAGRKGALRLASMGFHNVYAIQDAGIWEWEDAGYPMVYDDTFVDGMKPPCAGGVIFQDISTIHNKWDDGFFDFVIDVRTVENQTFANGWGWNHGHIPDSYALPGLNADPIDMETVGVYDTSVCKDSKILVHCWVGVAGRKGALRLASMGFHNVYAIQDAGIWEWESAGYPMVYGDTWIPGTRPLCTYGTCKYTKGQYKALNCCGKKTAECIRLKSTYRENNCCPSRRLKSN